MTKPKRLIVGRCYFHCTYFDKDLRAPDIRTLEYVEEIRDDEGTQLWLFRDPLSEVADPQAPDEREYLAFPDDQLGDILEIEDLGRVIAELIEIDRPNRKGEPDGRKSPDQSFSISLEATRRISEAIASGADFTINIGVRYTDDAFFVKRKDGYLRVHLYMRPLRNPEQNALVERICQENELHSVDDYLSDAGRTRILSYALDEDTEKTIRIVVALLRNAFHATADDAIVIK